MQDPFNGNHSQYQQRTSTLVQHRHTQSVNLGESNQQPEEIRLKSNSIRLFGEYIPGFIIEKELFVQ